MKQHIEDFYYDRVVETISEQFKLDRTRVKRIGAYENLVYECALDDKDCVFRITHESHRNKNLLKGELGMD